MNLAFITKRYDTIGGTERDLYEVTRRLATWGHEVHVYCHEMRMSSAPGVEGHQIPFRGASRTSKLWSLARQAKSITDSGVHDLTISYARVLGQDVIRCGGGTHPQFLKDMSARESALKNMLRSVDPYHRSMRHIEKKQYAPGNFKKILAISEVVKKEVMQTYDVSEDDIEIVYDGVDTDAFHPRNVAAHRAAIRRAHRIPEDAVVALFVGNAFRRKGLDSLLAGLAALKNRRCYVLVVGQDPEERRYKDMSRRMRLHKQVVFAGVQSDVERYYGAADFFVLPSVHEAFGNAVLEAFSSGLPAIVSSRAGAVEVMEGDLRACILNDPTSRDELAACMKKMMDAKTRHILGALGRAVGERFSLDVHARRSEEFFQRTLDASRA